MGRQDPEAELARLRQAQKVMNRHLRALAFAAAEAEWSARDETTDVVTFATIKARFEFHVALGALNGLVQSEEMARDDAGAPADAPKPAKGQRLVRSLAGNLTRLRSIYIDGFATRRAAAR